MSLLREDPGFNRSALGTALATTCTIHARTYTPVKKRGFRHDVAIDLGVAYDMLASAMTPAQRKACVTLMGTMIPGRQEYGTKGFQKFPHKHSYNHVGWHAQIHVLAQVMEGGTGDGGDEGDLWKKTLPIGIDIQRTLSPTRLRKGPSHGRAVATWPWGSTGRCRATSSLRVAALTS